ncbi:MAG TPA: hypothetical protein VFT78_13410 [Hanamia sp.]|nr:hypothetical protein [Hanamia sp.]
MKSVIIISFIFIVTLQKVYSQDFTKVDGVNTFLFNLPLNADKSSIVDAAKAKFKNNNIDSFKIEANTKVYFEDTTINYDIFGKALFTTLKIFDLWNYDDPKSSDTTFYVIVEASYGVDKKAERKMFAKYHYLKDKFEGRFVFQKPYAMYADGKIAEGFNFFFSDRATTPLFNIGWSNGGCFRDYRVAISFRRTNSYAQQGVWRKAGRRSKISCSPLSAAVPADE